MKGCVSNCLEKKYIITADDYGMCSIVDKAIDDCISAGLVTSTNVILNMEDVEAAKTLRQRFPQISIGIHWNVTAGKPLLNKTEIPTLVADDGNFYPFPVFIKLLHQNKISKQELILELTEQFNRFKDLCGQPDYWNTHQNSALDFQSFSIFNKLALKLGINKTRSFKRVYIKENGIHSFTKSIIESLKKNVIDIWFGYIIPCSGTKLPDGRMYYFVEKQNLNILNITDNVLFGKKHIIEIVIHPAVSGKHKSFGVLSDIRVDEYTMYSSQRTKDVLISKGIELVNFDSIK